MKLIQTLHVKLKEGVEAAFLNIETAINKELLVENK